MKRFFLPSAFLGSTFAVMVKKIYFFMVAVFLFCFAIYGQINTGEEPISFRSNVPALTKSVKTMKSFAQLDMKKIEQEDKDREDSLSKKILIQGKEIQPILPYRFGYPHKVNYNLDNSGEWVTLANGDKLWRLSITCQGASSINLSYDMFWIPDGTKFFVYGKDRKQTIGAMTSANNKGDKDNIQGFATGFIFGEQITLEYYLPKGVKETGVISVSKVIHGYRHITTPTRGYGGSGPCQVNVNCREGDNWQAEKNAVAKIVVDETDICTGSLINTTANDNRPLFLTADHCLEGADAITAPNLNNWSFYWHYESPDCANAIPTLISTVGATVVANADVSVTYYIGVYDSTRRSFAETVQYEMEVRGLFQHEDESA